MRGPTPTGVRESVAQMVSWFWLERALRVFLVHSLSTASNTWRNRLLPQRWYCSRSCAESARPRFAFHQIVLANSIQNLHSDSRLTDAIDDDSRNHFRTPISGTTRLARRAAVHQYLGSTVSGQRHLHDRKS